MDPDPDSKNDPQKSEEICFEVPIWRPRNNLLQFFFKYDFFPLCNVFTFIGHQSPGSTLTPTCGSRTLLTS